MAFELLKEFMGIEGDDSSSPQECAPCAGLDTVVQTFFAARTAAHRLHLLTNSFSRHLALEEFYDEIVDKIDEFAEVAQGKYGLLSGLVDTPPAVKFSSADPMEFMRQLCDFTCNVGRAAVPADDTVLQNIYDELTALVLRLKYKLENLS